MTCRNSIGSYNLADCIKLKLEAIMVPELVNSKQVNIAVNVLVIIFFIAVQFIQRYQVTNDYAIIGNLYTFEV
jgi:hypothetical protein